MKHRNSPPLKKEVCIYMNNNSLDVYIEITLDKMELSNTCEIEVSKRAQRGNKTEIFEEIIAYTFLKLMRKSCRHKKPI